MDTSVSRWNDTPRWGPASVQLTWVNKKNTQKKNEHFHRENKEEEKIKAQAVPKGRGKKNSERRLVQFRGEVRVAKVSQKKKPEKKKKCEKNHRTFETNLNSELVHFVGFGSSIQAAQRENHSYYYIIIFVFKPKSPPNYNTSDATEQKRQFLCFFGKEAL